MQPFIDRFTAPDTWQRLSADGTLPLCVSCVLGLRNELADIAYARPGAPDDVCDCCGAVQLDVCQEEASLASELVDQGAAPYDAAQWAAEQIIDVLAFAVGWDTQRTRWQQRGIEQ
jgi:hypothetical protein